MRRTIATILGIVILSQGISYLLWHLPSVQAAPPIIPPCAPIGTVGMMTVYRCLDDDYNKVCYVQSVSGMMFCLEQ